MTLCSANIHYMNQTARNPIFASLVEAASSATNPDNRRLLVNLTHTLPPRWDDRFPRSGTLVELPSSEPRKGRVTGL